MKHRKVTGVVISGELGLDDYGGQALLNQESNPIPAKHCEAEW